MSHLHGCRAGVALCRTDIRHTGVIRCVIVIIVPSCVIRSSLIVIKVTTCVNISPPIVIEATTCHYVAIPRLPAPAGFLYMGTMVFHIRGYGFQTRMYFSIYGKQWLKGTRRFPYTRQAGGFSIYETGTGAFCTPLFAYFSPHGRQASAYVLPNSS